MTPFQLCLLTGSFFGATAVCLGALGAHALQERISDTALAAFKTGVLYQMFHALALILLAALLAGKDSMSVKPTAVLWIFGVFLFSGSIYLLSLRPLLGIEHWQWLGPVTPLGGLLLIAGWIMLFLQAFRA